MINKRFVLFCFFCFCFLLSEDRWVFSVQDSLYFESDMSGFYGVSAWRRASKEQQDKMVDDFLIREGAFLLSKKTFLDFSPSFVENLYKKKRQLLVNYVYQLEIAELGKDSSRFLSGIDYLKEDLLVHHILFGYDGSQLRAPVGRNKKQAYFLCSSVLDTVTLSSFSSLASSLSDDGSAKRNLGRLGWMSWGSTVPAFEKAVFNAPLREVVGPIETEFGYHLAYVEEKRPSSFSFLGEDEFLDAVLLRSSSRDVGALKTLSSKYDSLVFSEKVVVFNDSLISSLYLDFSEGSLSSRINKNDIVGVLNSFKSPGVVCVFDGEGFGLEWFVDRLSLYSSSNRPNITNKESFYSIFKTLLLQEEAYLKGLSLKYDKKPAFKKQLLSFEKDFLYSLYFKNLVNNVPSPDSSSVEKYYLNNREGKYKTLKSIKFQELRVRGFSTADSLLNAYIDGEDFNFLVKNLSLDFSIKGGGFVGPVEKNYKKGVVSSFFKENVSVGFVGEVVDNLDGTFSIYMVKKIIPPSYIPFNKVYSRVSAVLHKKNQEEAKERAVKNFYKELNVVKNDSLF